MSHQGFTGTFKEFKQQFYSTIGDGSCLNVLDINLLKVILDGLKIKYSSRGDISHYFDKPLIVMYIYLFLVFFLNGSKRRALKEKIKKNKKGSILIGFSDRHVEENFKNYSLYFQKIFAEFDRENFCYITEKDQSKINADFDLNDLSFGLNFFSLKNIRLYFKIRKFIKDIKHKWTQNEFIDIQIACFVFYVNYLKWDFFLKHKKISMAVIEQHYHREGFILACKKRGIIVNELQHGLIAEEDIFYVIPGQVSGIISKALFPDNIFVYGTYWKNVLLKGCEFKEKQITELGFYHYEGIAKKENEADFIIKKQILITTQYSAQDYFIDYVKKISPLLTDDWHIILKPHPVEDKSIYKVLKELPNVTIVQGNLNELISKCEFLISIFSTTIFDAVRLGKPAFSLYFPIFSDYVNGIVMSKAAYSLNFEDNPVKEYAKITATANRSKQCEFYSEFNKKVFMNILLENK